MADDTTTQTAQATTGNESTTTSTADGKQAGDSTTGAATQTAQTTTEATDKTDKATTTETKIDTSSPEFKAALTAAIQAKLPQLQKQARAAVAKELSGEKEGEPTVDQLKTQIAEKDSRLRTLEARDQLETFVADKRNQVQASNLRGLFKYIKDDLQFDDDGKVTNFKEVLAQAKAEASEFFRGTSSSIDAGNGSRQIATADMNALIRGR
jgi:uncharacterized phage infection (PIP) family protein YhgE